MLETQFKNRNPTIRAEPNQSFASVTHHRGGRKPELNQTSTNTATVGMFGKPDCTVILRKNSTKQLDCELLFDSLPPRLGSSIHGYQWLLRRHSIYSGLCALRLILLSFSLCGTVLFIYSVKLQLGLTNLDVESTFTPGSLKHSSAKRSVLKKSIPTLPSRWRTPRRPGNKG